MAFNVKWLGIAQLFSYGLQFIVWAILARLLPPEKFGALGIALAFSNLVLIFQELGMGTAIIQKKDLQDRHLNTTFWICISICSVFLVFAVIIAPATATFFKNAVISKLLILFAVKLLVDSFGTIHEVLLKKNLQFKKLTFIEISSSIVFAIIAITAVYKGQGILSLGWGYLGKSLLKVCLLWTQSSFHPSFSFDRECFGELFDYGKNIVGFKIMSYIANNIDIFIIGKLLGSQVLGYYALAINLVNFPRQKLSYIVAQVAFPAFSKIQDHLEDVRNAYEKLIRYASLINFPLLMGLLLLAKPFVHLVYSAKWDPMTAPLQILCVYGLCYSITTFTGTIFTSTGKPQKLVHFFVIILITTVLAILGGIKFGLIGVALALSCNAILLNIVGNTMACGIIKMRLKSYYKALLPAALSCAIMAIVLIGLRHFQMNIQLAYLPFVIISILTGTLAYGAALFMVDKNSFKELTVIFSNMVNRK